MIDDFADLESDVSWPGSKSRLIELSAIYRTNPLLARMLDKASDRKRQRNDLYRWADDGGKGGRDD